MRNKIIEEYKIHLSLTKRQKKILIGLLLGDGHLEKLYNPALARLKVEHSYKQKEYVDWLYKKLKPWVRTEPKIRRMKTWGKLRKNYRFSTYGHRILGKLRERFYKGRKKIIPDDLEKDINSLALAVWYMDDGSIKSKRHKGVFLNTQGFRKNDVRRLQRILKNKFEIVSTTRKDKNGEQIYLGGKSGEKFIVLINTYIISSMKYKIPQTLRLTKLPKR